MLVARYYNKAAAKAAKQVRITVGYPRGFKAGMPAVMEIAPDKATFGFSPEEFEKAYRAKLDAIGVEKIRASIKKAAGKAKAIVLCCFEDIRKEGERCHRTIFAAWYKEQTGELIQEFPEDDAKAKKGPTLF